MYSRTDKYPCALSCKTHRAFTRRAYTPTAGFLSLSESYKRQKKSSDPIIETAKEYIKNHISSNLKAKDVAATVNLSESYFTIYFKTKTGQNFRDYVLNAMRPSIKTTALSQELLKMSLEFLLLTIKTDSTDHNTTFLYDDETIKKIY